MAATGEKRCRGCGCPRASRWAPCTECGSREIATKADVALQEHYAGCADCQGPGPFFCVEGAKLHRLAGGGLWRKAQP